jgi:hypothetical protein
MKKLLRVLFFALLFAIGVIPHMRAQWVKTIAPDIPEGDAICTFAVSGTSLFAGAWNDQQTGGVYRSTDNGMHWASANTGLWGMGISSLAVNGSYLFAGTWEGGLFCSTDQGTHWTPTSYPGLLVSALVVKDSNVLVASVDYGVLRTVDCGITWSAAYSGLYCTIVNCFCVDGANLYACTDNGVFVSTNDGLNWLRQGLTGKNVECLAVRNSTLFAATNKSGILRNSITDTTWTAVSAGIGTTTTTSIAVYGKNLIAGTWAYGIYLSTNDGASWTQGNTGLTSLKMRTVFIHGTDLFAGAWGNPDMQAEGGVWRRPMSELITGTERFSGGVPSTPLLHQNYPNPFTPSTTIAFNIPATCFVSLKIFDALGNDLCTLVSENLSAGAYTRQFTATAFGSGAYFYRLQAGKTFEVKRMTVLR